MTHPPLGPDLSDKEQAIYDSGCLDLKQAILEARRGGQHGTISLAVGLDPKVRVARVVRATERVVVASAARGA